MKGVVNAALGQEFGSVSDSVNPLRVDAQVLAQSVENKRVFLCFRGNI